MDDCIGRKRNADGSIQKPVAYLTCNFNAPIGDKPALFTHDEVTTCLLYTSFIVDKCRRGKQENKR